MVVPTPAATNPVPILSTGSMEYIQVKNDYTFKPLNPQLSPTCHLVALLGDYHILHDSGLRANKQ